MMFAKKSSKDDSECETDNESLANILIDFVKDELLKSIYAMRL